MGGHREGVGMYTSEPGDAQLGGCALSWQLADDGLVDLRMAWTVHDTGGASWDEVKWARGCTAAQLAWAASRLLDAAALLREPAGAAGAAGQPAQGPGQAQGAEGYTGQGQGQQGAQGQPQGPHSTDELVAALHDSIRRSIRRSSGGG